MGGANSSQTLGDTLNDTSTTIQKMSQNCVSYTGGGNTNIVLGSGNVENKIKQTVTANINQSCISQQITQDSLNTSMENAVTQQMDNQSVALTGILDDSTQTINDSLTANVTSTTTVDVVQNCIQNYDGSNVQLVAGTGNVITDVLQSSQISNINKCLTGNTSTVNTTMVTSNTASQYSQDISNNPMDFLTDAFKSLMGDGLIAIVLLVIMCICFVFVFVAYLAYRKSKAKIAAANQQPSQKVQ